MRALWLAAAVSTLAIIASSRSGYGQGIDIGKNEYVNSCAACHGAAGKGDGPVARSLKRIPTDLTKLSETNSGVFPFSRVYDVIDGRFEVETHGKRDMPVWGEAYRPGWGSAQSGVLPFYVSKELAESIVRGRILALIEYIFTLQGK